MTLSFVAEGVNVEEAVGERDAVFSCAGWGTERLQVRRFPCR